MFVDIASTAIPIVPIVTVSVAIMGSLVSATFVEGLGTGFVQNALLMATYVWCMRQSRAVWTDYDWSNPYHGIGSTLDPESGRRYHWIPISFSVHMETSCVI